MINKIRNILDDHQRQVRALELDTAVRAGFISEDEAIEHSGQGFDLELEWNRRLASADPIEIGDAPDPRCNLRVKGVDGLGRMDAGNPRYSIAQELLEAKRTVLGL